MNHILPDGQPAPWVVYQPLSEPLPPDPLAIVDSFLTNTFCPTGKGGGIDPHCSVGGRPPATAAGDPSKSTALAARRSSFANKLKLSPKAADLSFQALQASRAGDSTKAAELHRKAASAHSGMLKGLQGGDRQKNGFFAHRDAADAHEAAANEHQRATGAEGGKTIGGVRHVDEHARALSHTAHEGNQTLSLGPAGSLLKGAGVAGFYKHNLSPGLLAEHRNGHTPANSLAVDKPVKHVRDRLEAAGWVKTHVHNVPSLSGGVNHQEALKKGKHVATLVDFGYGTTTIRISKR